jgi:glycosyltransferase involved in cell wall biosynthesis
VTLNDTVILDFSRSPSPFMPDMDVTRELPGINIVGYLQSELGVGESARLCAASADAAEVAYSLVDFNVGCNSRTDDDRLSDLITNENPHPVNLFHINADQMPLAHSCLGHDFFRDHYNIGFWHWELPEFPDEWVPSFSYLQEVWVPSQFVMGAVSAKSPLPVVRMPHALAFSVPEGLRRKSLGLPEGKFLFLMMYDMHSYQSRKNPEAVVEAFRKAFPDPKDVALVIKTMNTQTYPDEWERLRRHLAQTPGVIVINRTFTRQEVYNLEALCDCFASLHRSEGFGLGLAESMYLGKPVIGTHWSGNVDFMNETNSCPVHYALVLLDQDYGPYKKGQHWAEADVDQAGWYMKKLVEDAEFRRRIADAGRHTLRTEFSPRTVGEMYRKRLEIISKLL